MGVNIAFDIVDNTDDIEPQVSKITPSRIAAQSTHSNSKSGEKLFGRQKKDSIRHPKIQVPEEG